jgi:hypothetical protein
MLHFDGRVPGYYKDNKLLTKNHLLFSTGFSVPVGRGIVINPFVAYSLTPVVKNSGSSRTNFFNYGIRFKLSLNKK